MADPYAVAQTVHELLNIDDNVLASMGNNPNFLKEFPFLSGIPRAVGPQNRGGCGGCAKRRQFFGVFNNAKMIITRMSVEKKKQFKQMLNAKQVRIYLQEGNRVIPYTF